MISSFSFDTGFSSLCFFLHYSEIHSHWPSLLKKEALTSPCLHPATANLLSTPWILLSVHSVQAIIASALPHSPEETLTLFQFHNLFFLMWLSKGSLLNSQPSMPSSKITHSIDFSTTCRRKSKLPDMTNRILVTWPLPASQTSLLHSTHQSH